MKEFLKNNVVFLDGAMGTLLQKKGLLPGELPELWNITHPNEIIEIHKQYFEAGSNVVNTNTFGANILKFNESELDEIIKCAVDNAKKARSLSSGNHEKFISLDIGPTGKLLKPLGNLDFEDAVSIFAQVVKLGVKYGVDLISIETMNDSYETKAALLAVKENCDLPVFVTNVYGEDAKLMTGASPEAMIAMLEGMGADAIGLNCSLGPKQIDNVVERMLAVSSVPVIIKPNAGIPRYVDGKTIFEVASQDFACDIAKFVKKGVKVIGGCCGTSPEYIKAIVEKTDGFDFAPCIKKDLTVVSSYNHAVTIDDVPILIGERINPTGKKRFKEALLNNDIDYILEEGIKQQRCGAHILDVNVGLPDIDEVKMLSEVVTQLQSVVDLPLQIDSSDPEAMESAMRRYNGKALVNSVNGKNESMSAIFPLVKKYGGVVIALTLDENGIPDSVDGRVDIAKRIIKTAEKYGIEKKDIVFDTLAMTVSADINAAQITLDSLKIIGEELECKTSLGVSNVSFGLPSREIVNSSFFTMALSSGLSAAIINPLSVEMLKAYYSFCLLKGYDQNCHKYIEFASRLSKQEDNLKFNSEKTQGISDTSSLENAIILGLKDRAAELTKDMLNTKPHFEIVKDEIIPALDKVGKDFENKKVFLPQLLISAEAAQTSFEIIKNSVDKSCDEKITKGTIVLATVKGDIHDIGKNIVKLLLENYGFNVVDLGKDVPPEKIVESVISHDASIAALSALMTTTVPAMEETIKLLNLKAPWCKTLVGGAVLNEDYAKKIGADRYAADAMESVRIAGEILR